MTKTKKTRNALFTSILSLLLCVSMLVGTTFAWFTDVVKSGSNLIAAGNLDVELYNSIGIDEAKKVDENTPLFEEVKLWEPGVVAYENLTVANVGTLALKYQMTMNITGENTVKGTNYKLSDVLKIAVVEGGVKGETREAVLQEVAESGASWETLKTKALSGDLTANTTEPVGLVIYWQPTENDNNWNLNNGKETSNGAETLQITLGINLFATQLESEKDSFDETYDKDAALEIPEVKVETPTADAFLAALKAGEVAVLTSDMTLDADGMVPAGITSAIDLNGHTLNVGEAGIFVKGNVIVTDSDGKGSMEVTKPGTGLLLEHGSMLEVQSGVINVNGDGSTNGIMVYNFGADTTINITGGQINANGESNAIGLYGGTTEMIVADGTLNGTIDVGSSGVLNLTYYGNSKPNVTNDDNTAVTLNIKQVVSNSQQLAKAIEGASATEETVIYLADGVYADDINLTLAAKEQKGDLVFKAVAGAKPVIAGTVTLGYRDQGVGAAKWEANVTFEDITFDHAQAGTFSIEIGDVKSLSLSGCKIVGDGETGIHAARGNATGPSKIIDCTFENAAIQGYGNFCTGLVIEQCAFNNSRINIQGGNSVTVKNCTFNDALTDANENNNYYLVRSNATPIIIANCEIKIDSSVNGVGVPGDKVWGVFVNRGATNWNITDVEITLTDAALAQPELKVINCTSTGTINTTNLTVNGMSVATNREELKKAVADGATNILLMKGEYNVDGCGGKTLTINGSKDAVLKLYNEGEDGCDYGFGGNDTGIGNITFNGVTIDTTANTGNYKGYAYMKGIFNDCSFIGAYSLNNANDFEFNRCTFDFKNGYFWTWGAKMVTFNECIFNGNSKNILAHGYESTVININNCTFAATEKGYTGSGDNTAAVEIDPAGTNTYTINFSGENTVTDSYAGWTRVKDGSTGHIINGLS